MHRRIPRFPSSSHNHNGSPPQNRSIVQISQSSRVRTTASANSRPAVGEHQSVAVARQQPVLDHGLGPARSASFKHRQRQPVTQPHPQHHVLGVQCGRRRAARNRPPAAPIGQRLRIGVGVLDIPPPRRADVAVRAGSGTPPFAAVPVADVVPALAAGQAQLDTSYQPQPRRGQPRVDQLVAVRELVVVGCARPRRAAPGGPAPCRPRRPARTPTRGRRRPRRPRPPSAAGRRRSPPACRR